MADPFLNEHVTTTTNTASQIQLRFDVSYIKTVPGKLKLGMIVLNGLACCLMETCGLNSPAGHFFLAVALVGFSFSVILLALYLFHFVEKHAGFPWFQVEFTFSGIWSVMYLIATALCAARRSGAVRANAPIFLFAVVFGVCAMFLYGYDAFRNFDALKAGALAQGERSRAKQSASAIESPIY